MAIRYAEAFTKHEMLSVVGTFVYNCQDLPNSTEEATSSMEIDSATDMASHKPIIPTADSYVSTSETAEPTSRAQVLEELRARIRELEGSPFKVRSSQDDEHYKCYICKVRFSIVKNYPLAIRSIFLVIQPIFKYYTPTITINNNQ